MNILETIRNEKNSELRKVLIRENSDIAREESYTLPLDFDELETSNARYWNLQQQIRELEREIEQIKELLKEPKDEAKQLHSLLLSKSRIKKGVLYGFKDFDEKTITWVNIDGYEVRTTRLTREYNQLSISNKIQSK